MFVRSQMLLAAGAVAVTGALALAPARAQDAVKIGLILPMTGGQASTGKQIDNAVKLYMQQNGDTVAGRKIEVILKDDAAIPDNTKRLTQELIVNDKVNFIAGFGVTPAALAAAPEFAEAHFESAMTQLSLGDFDAPARSSLGVDSSTDDSFSSDAFWREVRSVRGAPAGDP